MRKDLIFPSLRLSPGPVTSFTQADLIVSAGQSNESGRGLLAGKLAGIPHVSVFANDYTWKQLEEPSDSAIGQIDAVSSDGTAAAHSSLVKVGRDLYQALRRPLAFVVNAKGGTTISEWEPPVTRYDRSTLYGSMDHRVQQAMPGKNLKCVTWFQGESDAAAGSGAIAAFVGRYTDMVEAFRADYGDVPFVFTQLAVNRANATDNNNQQSIRELQRLMETGSGDATELPLHFMVVTHDLAMIDTLHLNQAGQIEFGRRRALAIRQHVYGEVVNGTGPRLVSITQPTTSTVKVKTTRTINNHTTYDNYFTVYDNAVAATISSLNRDPGDDTAVLITLSGSTAGTVTVEYKPPYTRSANTAAANVVKDSDGLPLPAFGPVGLTP